MYKDRMESKYHLCIKFFTESKDEEQLTIAYNEIEAFMSTFENFLFYFHLDPTDLSATIVEALSEESK